MNLDTCRTSFAEVNVSGSAIEPLPTNVSELISNSLAIIRDSKLLVVAKDGTGDFTGISEAVDEASKGSGIKRFVIHVKKGVYKENVDVGMRNLMLVGDGIGKTVITGSRSAGGGSTTYNSATFAVTGERFIARGITFQNTAGPAKHQAVALRSNSDLSVFYQCSFEGYQDTLYNCNIYVRRPMSQQKNTITAQGGTDPNQNTGISIQSCGVTAAKDFRPVQSSIQTFLGRPWKEYSRTVYMEIYMDGLISPAGWLEWSGDFALETLFYGEFRNTGTGSKWGGYHVITDPSTALEFTARNLIAGEMWLPSTGLPFNLDL
ncbi:Pectinesterase [Cocos nucifera]|uniref:Pectinesterase n=1 Tax=Cocos nucifera TaxID=13894 RepID=A0A8K0IWV9_COCNU|nr:Pectinesterase [Cocos nucifera]